MEETEPKLRRAWGPAQLEARVALRKSVSVSELQQWLCVTGRAGLEGWFSALIPVPVTVVLVLWLRGHRSHLNVSHGGGAWPTPG